MELCVTIVACPPVPNSQDSIYTIIPPLCKLQMPPLNNSYRAEHVPGYMHLLPKYSTDQSFPQMIASRHHKVSQFQWVTVQIVRLLAKPIVYLKTKWAIVSDKKYLMIDNFWEIAIEVQDWQCASTGAHTSIQSG